MFRVLPELVDRRSRVLLLDPTYGEYAHVLENVIGCDVYRLRRVSAATCIGCDVYRFALHRLESFDVDLAAFERSGDRSMAELSSRNAEDQRSSVPVLGDLSNLWKRTASRRDCSRSQKAGVLGRTRDSVKVRAGPPIDIAARKDRITTEAIRSPLRTTNGSSGWSTDPI